MRSQAPSQLIPSKFSLFRTPCRLPPLFVILSHQWIAASLNVAAGTDPSAVSAELAEAEALLNTCVNPGTPDPARAIELAGILDDYNNGVIGPGHCDDDDE